MQRCQIHNTDVENMNTIEESANAYEKEQKAINDHDDIEKGRGTELDRDTAGTPTDRSSATITGASLQHIRSLQEAGRSAAAEGPVISRPISGIMDPDCYGCWHCDWQHCR